MPCSPASTRFVIDLQDVGVRFYTYHTTMAVRNGGAAKKASSWFSIGRTRSTAGRSRADVGAFERFISYFQMPVRHGMTMGELAKLFNEENKIGADLRRPRGELAPRLLVTTRASWINPSPNMRNQPGDAVPGIGAIEHSTYRSGRTDQPFEQFGAPWIDGLRLSAALTQGSSPASASIRSFTPKSSKYKRRMPGRLHDDHQSGLLQPVCVGLEIAAALATMFGEKYDFSTTWRLFGTADPLERVKRGEDPAAVAARWTADEAHWRRLRAKYLLYR
jgi:uncharacterized protein YbbC (DUF1343 family)